MVINMELNAFLNGGIRNIIKATGRFYLGSRRGQTFLLKAAGNIRRNAKIRERKREEGLHVPPFLIASIASTCNLRCEGCYAWANGGCHAHGDAQSMVMEVSDWERVFTQAADLGVSFILLAGGEPLLQRRIIEKAARCDRIIFPVFTNGTLLTGEYLDFFDRNRNLIPVISMEGEDERTDERRGKGMAEKVWQAAGELKKRGILYGVSVTVTRENVEELMAASFVEGLQKKGCGLVFYVEYVPVEKGTEDLTLTQKEQARLQDWVLRERRKRRKKGLVLLSFPGDEEAMGGCLAAGRGFFHINYSGGAEPCPFSPYSEENLKEQSLEEVLRSPFFERVREISGSEALFHKGGCALFRHQEEVESAAGKKENTTGESESAAGKKENTTGESESAAGEKESAAGEKESAAGEKESAPEGKENASAVPESVEKKESQA
ncbi:MAG: radical SAM protein [Clostridium sp.]|nr:radical SAM protein [Clostridium sp.]